MQIEIDREMANDMMGHGVPRYFVMQAGDGVFFVADLVECKGTKCHKPECAENYENVKNTAELFGYEVPSELPDHTESYTDYVAAKAAADLFNAGIVTMSPDTVIG